MAIKLAKKGEGKVNPNPLVGAVIVKEGKVIGKGYHREYGKEHAEVNAFKSLREDAIGATLYVTLEPCSHYGKTPPCINKIIENKIAKVVIGCVDPNSLVSGRGIKKLQEAGIEVVTGVLEEECKGINEVFMKYITTKKPFVMLKGAMTLDGKICTASGESKCITSEKSRKDVHNLRNRFKGIMVGINTVIADDPQLTCRINGGRNPIRIIVDTNLRVPLNAKVLDTSTGRTIIATSESSSEEKIEILKKKGVEILKLPTKDEGIDLEKLMIALGKLDIDGILLEGGGTLAYSALEAGIVHKVRLYIAPKIIGGREAKTVIEGAGCKGLKDAFLLKDITLDRIDEDIVVEGRVN